MKPGGRALGFAESYRGTDAGTGTDTEAATDAEAATDTETATDAEADIESDGSEPARSTLGGAVVRGDGTVEEFVFETATVGGLDATDALVDAWRRLDRPDVRHVLVAGVALAWYNVLDLEALAAATDRPVVAVTFEESEGLSDAIAETFDGTERERRLDAYEALPERRRLALDDGAVFVRSVGVDPEAADRIVAAHADGGRPEPLRVAKRAARGVDEFRRSSAFRPG